MRWKKTVNSVLERTIGYRLARKDPNPLESFFAMLRHQNFQAKRIYDVGANQGNWTRCAIDYFPKASYTLVEPQDFLKSNIKDLIKEGFSIEWINAGAGSECGTQLFTIAYRNDMSSFASVDGDRANGDQVEITVTTLNKIASTHREKPDIVKIDAEGWDLKVLEGASDLIGVTDIFLLEAAVCSRNDNTILSVMQRFDALGYDLIDITDINRSPKHLALWLVELAFLRRGSSLLEGAMNYE